MEIKILHSVFVVTNTKNVFLFTKVFNQHQHHQHQYQKQFSLPNNISFLSSSSSSNNHHSYPSAYSGVSSQPQPQPQPQLYPVSTPTPASSASSILGMTSPKAALSQNSVNLTSSSSSTTSLSSSSSLLATPHSPTACVSRSSDESVVSRPASLSVVSSPKTELEKIDELHSLTYEEGENEDEATFEDEYDDIEEEEKGDVVVTRLADLFPSTTSNNINNNSAATDRAAFYRRVIVAVDRLYPDTKWPLHDTWTFWHVRHDPSQSWEANIREMVDVAHVEDFWSVTQHVCTPASMSSSSSLAGGDITFFKKGIRPMWEDAQNKAGGSWLHTIHQFANNNNNGKRQQQQPEIYEHWLETLLSLIGDQFCGESSVLYGPHVRPHEHEHLCDFIAGVYASPRAKQHKLALWTKNYKDEKTTRLIG